MRVEEFRIGPTVDVASAGFSPDGSLIALLNRTCSEVVDLDGKPAAYPFDDAPASALAFRPGSSEIAVALNSRNSVRRLLPDGIIDRLSLSRPFRVAYSPDGKFLAAGSAIGQVMVWDLQGDEAKKIFSVDLAREPVCSLAFNSDNKRLYATLASGEPYLIDVTDQQEHRLELGDGREFYAVACHSSNSDVAVFGGVSPMLWLRNEETRAVSARESLLGESVRSLTVYGDKLIAVGAVGVQVLTCVEKRLDHYHRWTRPDSNRRILAAAFAGGELRILWHQRA